MRGIPQGRLPNPEPQQSPFADPDTTAKKPDRGPFAAITAGAVLGGMFISRLAGASGLVSTLIGGAVGAVAAGAMLLRGERVDDDTPIAPEWTVRDAEDGARIMTWNIRGGAGSWGGLMRSDVRDDILDAIDEVDPDVVVMQEVDRRTPRTLGRDLAAELAEGADASDWAFAWRRTGPLSDYGHLVMTRNGYEIEDDEQGRDRTYTMPLTTNSGVPRIADVSAIRTPDGHRFTMMGTHLISGNPENRDLQMREIAEAVDLVRAGRPLAGLQREGEDVDAQELPETLVLAGDFNAFPSSLRKEQALVPDEHGLRDAFSQVGVPLTDPRRISYASGWPLDHMFTTGDAQVVAASVLHQPRGDWDDGIRRLWPSEHTSDHDALGADVRLS